VRPTTRRELIGAAAAGAAFAAVPPAWAKPLLSRRAAIGPGRFLDGVASGEPSPTAVTFWAKLTTARPRSGARLIVARDEGMNKVVATAVVPTGRALDGTLKARIGGLRPHTHYYYLWESGTDVSPLGRTRTLVPAGSRATQQLAVSSCQAYQYGYFRPHAQAAIDDVDLCVFLGDYIYEVKRPPTGADPRVDPIDSNDLRSYREKYRLYRADEALRELHRVHPAVHIWDDHEVANNYTDNDPAPSPLQRAAAYRVAFEWLPRIVYPRERYRIFKRIPIGATVDLYLLDERQYRAVDDQGRPTRILGDRQLRWLIAGLKASTARWKIVANQVVIAPLDLGGDSEDSWGAYGDSRTRLLGEIERAGIDDVVFLTGDAHVFMANVLASDPEVFRSDPAHRPTATEYVGGSVTTPGTVREEAEVQSNHPWVRQWNSVNHGYAHVVASDTQLVTEFRASDVFNPNGGTVPFERFLQPAGANNFTRERLARPGGV
jgi:phosphodiesterase/alkaline phosphatase D-like protein